MNRLVRKSARLIEKRLALTRESAIRSTQLQDAHSIVQSAVQNRRRVGIHEATQNHVFTQENNEFSYDKVYSSLNEVDRQIRLITLAPGFDNQPITCELSICSLLDPPPYQALSYCAGDPADCGKIQLDGRSFNVFKPLYSALRHLRRPDQVIAIWVDQLCINQKDISERNGQVLIMKGQNLLPGEWNFCRRY